MKTYLAYTAIMSGGRKAEFITAQYTKDLDSMKAILKNKFRLNPYYAIITDGEWNVLHNNFMVPNRQMMIDAMKTPNN